MQTVSSAGSPGRRRPAFYGTLTGIPVPMGAIVLSLIAPGGGARRLSR